MKNQKGITLVSLIIYIIVAMCVIATLTMLGIYFTSNVAEISEDSVGFAEMDVFNSYFLKDIKEKGNDIENIAQQSSRLPEGYQEVEYIESTGTQYIDTGYNATPNTRINIRYKYNNLNLQQRIFSTIGSSTFIYDAYINGSSCFAFAYQNNSGNWISTGVKADLDIHTFDFDGKEKTYKIDNGEKYSGSLASYTATNTSNKSLCIFSAHDGGSNNAYANFYYAQIYDDGILVRDFIPCYRKSDNVIGMYDKVNDEFYTNSGTGEFLKGTDVKSTSSGNSGSEIEFTNGSKYYLNTDDKCVYYEKDNNSIKILNEIDALTFTKKTENDKTIIVVNVTINGKEINQEYVLGEENTYQDYKDEVATTKTYTRKLPDGYKQVEYIESTGTQYIDTGVTSGSNISAYFDAYFETAQTARTAFGTGGDNGWGFYCGSGAFWDNYNDDKNTSISNSVVGHFIVNKNNNTTNIKVYDTSETQIKDVTTTHSEATFSYPNTIYVFHKNGSSRNKGIFKLYSFKLWKDNTLIRDFVPCYRESDNVIGLYDMVNDQFYTNAGTGNFFKGPNVIFDDDDVEEEIISLPSEYQQVEYIESTGTQYINTGLVLEENYIDIEYKFKYLSEPSNEQAIIGNYTTNTSGCFTLGYVSGGIFFYTYKDAKYISDAIEMNTDYVVKLVANNGILTGQYNSYTINANVNNISSANRTLYLFNRGDLNNTYFTGRLYYLNIRNSDNKLVRNFIPCYRKSDNVIGMYDTVNDEFYTNSGTGTFTAGPNVTD